MVSFMENLGEAAGDIWRTLELSEGPLTTTQIKNKTELPDSLLYAGLGWLAREGKIRFGGKGRKIEVSLT
jgi:hypothetical protein